jgi:hypothetical protein
VQIINIHAVERERDDLVCHPLLPATGHTLDSSPPSPLCFPPP